MIPARCERLLRQISCPAKALEPLAPLTTFHIGGPAQILAEVRSTDDVVELMKLLTQEQVPFFYLGLGSNLLVSDAGFDGVVIRATGELCRIELSHGHIRAGSGARLLDVTIFAAAQGLSGMETLCGIPGSVGGGLYMNAGAYGGEIADTFVAADALTADGRIVTLTKDEIGFGYRSAPALQNVLILESRYALAKGEPGKIYSEMRRVWKLRREKQPLDFPSAGSMFKRPPGDYAGRLIEAVGGKGLQIGGARVSPKHAGIFVNAGNATAADVTALVREIRRRVYEKFGIMLQTEVKPVGFEADPFTIES
ncbi:MAG TPA: UDP-N-acetylmuramate dehydrogenase [bacterium]|jgi:UDP-N-acetylmuramate dehydrogenase